MIEELRKYINQTLSAIGTPRNEKEKGMVEAYCDILSKISSDKELKRKRRTLREVFDSYISGVSDMSVSKHDGGV